MLKRSNLHSYQNEMVNLGVENPYYAFYCDLGLGKTISTLTIIADLLASGDVKRVLIVAPLRVANSVWKQEALGWEHTKHLDIGIATGNITNRRNVLNQMHDVTVINQDVLKWLITTNKWQWDMLVYDESHNIKSPSSQRFKALKTIRGKLSRVILLTGTPAPNSLLDVWSQVYMLDMGVALGRSMTQYKQVYFTAEDYMGYKMIPKEGAQHKIMNKIAHLTHTLKAEDYVDMPERIDITVDVELPTSVREQYKELEKEFYLEVNKESIEVVNAAVLASKLLQVCNGGLYDSEKKAHILHDEKIKALKELTEAHPTENMIIAYNFKFDMDMILKAFPHAVVLDKKGEAIERWNRGEVKMLLASPKSAGAGLNLQHGGSFIVWYGLSWNLGDYLQFNGRVFRQGQKRGVRIVHLVVKDGMDERVMQAINSKNDTQMSLIDHLKLYQEEF